MNANHLAPHSLSAAPRRHSCFYVASRSRAECGWVTERERERERKKERKRDGKRDGKREKRTVRNVRTVSQKDAASM